MSDKRNMPNRTYNQNCGLARASDLLGERWTLLIVRDLLVSPRRFSELERRMKGMGTNLLSKRLKQLGEAGLIAAVATTETVPGHYCLTAMGHALEPAILNLVQWSVKYTAPNALTEGLHFPDWDLLVLKALFRPNPAIEQSITVQFCDGDWKAWARVDGVGLVTGLGVADAPVDIVFKCNISALRLPEPRILELPASQRQVARIFLSAFAFPQ